MLLAFLTRVVLPTGEQNRNNVSHKLLCLLFCMIFNRPFNLHHFMLNHMLHALPMTRHHTLPYSKWLTYVFEYFRVDFEGEENVTAPIPALNEATFANIGVFKLSNRAWASNETLIQSE